MRTTLVLSDETFRQLKSMAAMRGMTSKEILRTAVEHELVRGASGPSKGHRVKFPILESEEPGTLHLTNVEIEDLLT